MKRRDFVKRTAIAAAGATLVTPLAALAEEQVTHLTSDDVSPRAALDDKQYAFHFMAIGDWGRNGEYHQTDVAKQMGLWATQHKNDFVVSVGDNFYPDGVVSEMDPQFHYSFENVYTAHSLQCAWYSVLGNHDYHEGADPEAQIRYGKISRRWRMPALYYTKEIALSKDNNDKALLIMIDTDPYLFPKKKDYTDKQTAWLIDTLKNASADVKWKIVVGHHPYYTVGPRIKNYDTLTMRAAMVKIFEDYKVDVYLSGHDHSLQHLKPEGYTHHFISGAGSELTQVTAGVPYARFAKSENGFMSFAVASDQINVKAIDLNGKVLYDTNLTK